MSKVLVRRAIACSAALAFLAACSSSKSIGSADATTTAPAASTVPATVAPTTADTVAPTVPPTACADATAPSSAAQSVTAVDGDWNGDAVTDTSVSWAEPIGGTVKWFIRAEVNGGLSSTIALGDLGVGYAQALDNVDVDFALGAEPGVNRDEILAVVGSGASGLNLGIFGIGADGCIFQFDDGAGAPFIVSVAVSIGQMSGLACDGAAGSEFLVVLTASTVDDITYDTVDYRIERSGEHSLALGTPLPGSLLATDAALDLYGQAECGGLLLIGGGGD